MDHFSQNSDRNSTGSDSGSETELILASNRPKKRAGRRVFKETRHPVFRGVRKRNSDKWVCELREPNKKTRIWLGTYPTAEMAARAHDVAALALRGKSACLNFADSSWRLPKPASNDAADIRRAAAEAAEAFRPPRKDVGGGEEAVFQTPESYRSGLLEESTAFCVGNEGVLENHDWLADMAEEPLLSPPRCMEYSMACDDVETFADVSLWSYSI